MQPQKEVPNPLLALGTRGAADVLDQEDLGIFLSAEEASALSSYSKQFQSASANGALRVQSRTAYVDLNCHVSLHDLLNRSDPIVCVQPFRTEEHGNSEKASATVQSVTGTNVSSHTFADDCKSSVVLGAAALAVVENQFKGVLKEDIKLGSSLYNHYKGALARVEQHEGSVREPASSASTADTCFCATTQEPLEQPWILQPQLPSRIVTWAKQTAFLRPDHLDFGIVFASDGHVYVPEHHGMAQYIKSYLPRLVSAVRVLALSSAPADSNVLRMTAATYQRAKELILERSAAYNMQSSLTSLQLFIAYKDSDEDWEDESERARLLQRSDLHEKRLIRLRLMLGYYCPQPTITISDRFVSDPRVVGVFAPGVPFIDAVSCKPAEGSSASAEQQWNLPSIVPVHLADYLEKNRVTREAIKKGKAPSGYRNDVPYRVWAKELVQIQV